MPSLVSVITYSPGLYERGLLLLLYTMVRGFTLNMQNLLTRENIDTATGPSIAVMS